MSGIGEIWRLIFHVVYGGEADSWRHSLLECTMFRCVWALVPKEITEHMERTTEPEAKHWIFEMMSTLKHEDLIRCFVTL